MRGFLLWAGVIGAVGVVVLPALADSDKGKHRGHAKDRCEICKERQELRWEAQGRGELHSTLNRALNEAEYKVHGRGKMHRALNQTLNAKRSHDRGRSEKHAR